MNRNKYNKYLLDILLIFFIYCNLSARIIIVDKKNYVLTIQQAVAAAKNLDTIIVKHGNYFEENIIVDKSLTLIGENFPVIDGRNTYQILTIKSSNVIIKGFIFQNAGVSFLKDNSAIRLDSASNCIIEGNKFINNFFAIYISKSLRNEIKNNIITASSTKQTLAGNGIHVWNSRELFISGNKIEGHRDGIYLEFVKSSVIENNLSKNNLRYGLHFMFSDSCIYRNNKFEKNRAGVAVMFTKNILMENNLFLNNWGSASCGLLLKEIYDSKILNNKFIKNTYGIYFESCNRIEIIKNNFVENGWALKLMANSMDNNFYLNNFIENTFDIATNSSQTNNTFKKNYWSKYNGYDLNKDNIGDIPYRPVKLFSFIITNNPAAMILLRSFFIDLLNFAENIIPTITPVNLVDENPLMRMIL